MGLAISCAQFDSTACFDNKDRIIVGAFDFTERQLREFGNCTELLASV